jgi:hypothetical protein
MMLFVPINAISSKEIPVAKVPTWAEGYQQCCHKTMGNIFILLIYSKVNCIFLMVI